MKYPKSKQLSKKKINLLFKEKPRSYFIKELDKIVSDRVRSSADWTCERCHTQYKKPTNALHCSHYYSRRYLGTRWDFDNLMALCFGCHKLWESDKQGEYQDVMLKRLGINGLQILRVKAYAVTKFSKQDLELLLT